jgi:hypothetical protein
MKFYHSFLLIIVCFYAISESIVIAQNNYAASLIAPELKANAKAVVRLDETTITIISINKASTRKHFVITILNDNGRELSQFRQGYDRFSSISNIEYIIHFLSVDDGAALPGSFDSHIFGDIDANVSRSSVGSFG